MEDLCRKFPAVAQNVFAKLDDKSLTDCKVVGKVLDDFLNNERFFWIRIIKKYFEHPQSKFSLEWKKAISRTPKTILKQIATAIHQFPTRYYYCSKDWSPLHIAAINGDFTLFKLISDKMTKKNPAGFVGVTPLHMAAEIGHLEICELIISALAPESPTDNVGKTPLHYATSSGNLEVYKLLSKKFSSKNPVSFNGHTPLHFFAAVGDLEMCKFIIDDLADNNPAKGNFRITPFHLAARMGQLEVCKLFLNNIQNVYPEDINGMTPYAYAKIKGHSEVCQLIDLNLNLRTRAGLL